MFLILKMIILLHYFAPKVSLLTNVSRIDTECNAIAKYYDQQMTLIGSQSYVKGELIESRCLKNGEIECHFPCSVFVESTNGSISWIPTRKCEAMMNKMDFLEFRSKEVSNVSFPNITSLKMFNNESSCILYNAGAISTLLKPNQTFLLLRRFETNSTQKYNSNIRIMDGLKVWVPAGCKLTHSVISSLCPLPENVRDTVNYLGNNLHNLSNVHTAIKQRLLCSCHQKTDTIPLEDDSIGSSNGNSLIMIMIAAAIFLVGIITIFLTCPKIGKREKPNPSLNIKIHQFVDKKLSDPLPLWNSSQPLQLLSLYPLGQGSFGQVYLVEHTLLKKKRALKVINVLRTMQRFSLQLQMFEKEMKHMSEVESVHVVKFYSYWIEGSEVTSRIEDISSTSINSSYCNLFILMELCDSSLDKWLRSTVSCRDNARVLDILFQIATGLQALHSKSIIHRDLKPSNILCKNKVWKIGDLGLSTKYPDVDQSMSVRGDANYRSPEMSRRERYSEKTDVFSLGLVFLEIVYPEISLKEKYEIFQRLRNVDGYFKMHFSFEKAQEEIANIIEKMLEQNQEQRISICQVVNKFKNVKNA